MPDDSCRVILSASHDDDTLHDMRFIIELDGAVVDIRQRYYQAHRLAQNELGLASRTPDEFWRLFRKGAPPIEIVRPHRIAQVDDYARRFAELIVRDDLLALDRPQADAATSLAALGALGICCLVVRRPRRAAVQELLDRHELWRFFRTMRMMPPEQERRAMQFAELAQGDGRALAIVASDSMALSARQAGLITIGVAAGACTPKRLQQAGADLNVASLSELVEIIRDPPDSLIRAGFRPNTLNPYNNKDL